MVSSRHFMSRSCLLAFTCCPRIRAVAMKPRAVSFSSGVRESIASETGGGRVPNNNRWYFHIVLMGAFLLNNMSSSDGDECPMSQPAPTHSLSQFVNERFACILIGGGTAGMWWMPFYML